LLFAFWNHNDGFASLALLASGSGCARSPCLACGTGCACGAGHAFRASFAGFTGRARHCNGNFNHRRCRSRWSFGGFLACAQAECGDSDQQEWIFHDVSFLEKMSGAAHHADVCRVDHSVSAPMTISVEAFSSLFRYANAHKTILITVPMCRLDCRIGHSTFF
jgi:hypothetical protein